MEHLFEIAMDKAAVRSVSALGLAHVGDGVFELLVRTQLCAGGKVTPGGLHRATVQLVSAPAQAERVERLLPLLTDEEMDFFRRGRNAHAHHSIPRNATHGQYASATGLETLFGALYLLGRRERIEELFWATAE